MFQSEGSFNGAAVGIRMTRGASATHPRRTHGLRAASRAITAGPAFLGVPDKGPGCGPLTLVRNLLWWLRHPNGSCSVDHSPIRWEQDFIGVACARLGVDHSPSQDQVLLLRHLWLRLKDSVRPPMSGQLGWGTYLGSSCSVDHSPLQDQQSQDVACKACGCGPLTLASGTDTRSPGWAMDRARECGPLPLPGASCWGKTPLGGSCSIDHSLSQNVTQI